MESGSSQLLNQDQSWQGSEWVQSHQGCDMDMQRIQDAGYAIKDRKEIVNNAACFIYTATASAA